MNKPIIWIILIVLVVCAGTFLWQSPSKNTYADPEGVFSFEYPSNLNVSGRNGPIMAEVMAPNGQKLVIRWSGGITNCPEERVFDGDCWSFDYPAGSQYAEDFENIIESFRYLVNSD